MPVVAAAAAAVFTSAVSFATAAGTALLASVGGAGLAGATIAGIKVATIVGALQIGTTAMSIFSMARKPKAGASSPSPIAFKADPNAYLHYVAGGPVGVGGNQVFAQTAGSKNKYLTYTTALSAGGPVHSVQPFKANDNVVTFGANNGGAGAIGTYSNRMWQKFALGAVIGATALTMGDVTGNRDTPGNNGGHPYEWTSQHTLPSIAHTLWTLLSDPDKYPQLPKPLWEVRGGPVYDPRKDSTFPGGNGPQRWNDRNTWSTEGNQNPFLQALTFCIGHTFNGVRLGGVGVPIQMIDVPRFVEGANVADANGWKIAWVWNTGMRKWDVLTGMLQAGGGTPLVRGSKISCMVEAPRVSIGVVTDADIMGPVSITGTTNKRDRKNTIIPRCKSAAHKWTVQPFGAVTSATYLAEDNGRERPEEIEYESIADNGDGGRQLRQIAAYDLANMREGLGGVLPLPMRFMKYRAGDCLTVNAPKTLLNGQKVLILKREVDTRSKRVNLTVRSETDGKHDFALGRTADAPPAPSLTGVDPTVVEPPAPGAWTFEPGQTPGGGGQEGGMPVVVIVPADPDPNNPGGAHGDDPAATNVVVRYRKEGTNPATGEPWPWVYEEFPATAPKIELKGLAPLTTYEVEMAYRVRGIVGLWQPYGLVTTQSLIATNALALGNRDAQAILADLDAIPEAIDAAVGELDAAVQLALGNLNSALGQLDDAVDAIEVDLNDPAAGLKVRVGSVETVAANAASRVGALEITVNTAGTGLLARTGSLETVTANLQTGKADASRVSTIEVDLNAAGTGLKARTSSLETATANLQTGKADASRVTALEARAVARANIIPNSTGAAGLRGWVEQYPGQIGTTVAPGDGPRFESAQPEGGPRWAYLVTAPFSVIAQNPYSFQAELAATGLLSGSVRAYVSWRNAQGVVVDNTILQLTTNPSTFWQRLTAENYVPGATVTNATVSVDFSNATFAPGSYLAWRRLKLEFGAVATMWTDDAQDVAAAARTTLLETATANLQTGKADASRVATVEADLNTAGTGLKARTGSLETVTANLQAGKADASRVATLEARAVALPNLIQDGSFNAPMGVNWYLEGGAGPFIAYDGQIGSYLHTAGPYLTSKVYPAGPGTTLSVSWSGIATDPAANVYLQALPSYALMARATRNAANNWGQRYESNGSTPAPAGTTGFRVVIDSIGNSMDVSRIKVNYGSTATQWTDELTNRESAASIRTLETVTANLQTGKADASRVTVLESRVANIPNLLVNSDFSQNLKYWTVGGGIWTTYKDAAWGSIAGGLGGEAGTTYYLISDLVRVYGGTTYTMSFNGDGGAAPNLCGFYCSQYDVNGNYIAAGDGLGFVDWTGVDWVTRKSTTFTTRPDTVYLKVVLSKPGQYAPGVGLNAFASRIMLSIGTAQPGWNDDATARDSFARLTVTEQATTDLYGRTRARWALGAAVPGAEAFMQAQAEVTAGQAPTSSVAIGAQQFAVYNQVGQNWLKALEVVGGNVLLSGGLQAGAFIRLGNGNGWPVALKPVDFSAADGEVISFGTDLGSLPALQFALNNLAPLNSGETYDVRASSLTSTGFTMYAKINVPATPSNQSVARQDINQQSTTIEGVTAVYVNFDGRPEAADGTYTIQADGYTNYRVPRRTEVTDYEGGGLLRVWARKGGAWVQVGNVSYSWSDLQGNPSNSDITASTSWSIYEVMQLGSGVTGVAVGVPQPQEMLGRTAYAIGCGPIQWQAQGSASGVRSATPNGQKTRVTVRPQ